MQIDRRITNGLAWAGAVLVVAIPLADFAIRQASPDPTPQLAVVREEPEEPVTLPTPSADRPQVAQAEEPEPVAAPVVASETPRQPAPSASNDPVDSFINSGRTLPSYISGGDAPAQPARPTTTTAVTPSPQPTAPAVQPTGPAAQPAVPTTQPAAPIAQPESTASVTRTPITLPTPVSQRPPSVPQSQVRPAPVPVPQAPLIVDEPTSVFTAEDLDDWESGPLSEFLANRGQAQSAPAAEYDNDGFFLDEGPNSRRQERFPRAYGEGFYYPFAE